MTAIKSNLKFKDIDAYHASFPAGVQKMLGQLRQAIKQAAPQATETISYNMPAFRQNKMLVYYAVNKAHIGFYPTPGPIVHFKDALAEYNISKGAIRFPINKPLPLPLIKKIVRFRVLEDKERERYGTARGDAKSKVMADVAAYNNSLSLSDKAICEVLTKEISKHLHKAENKVWHRHPVWFLDGNPIVGYSKEKRGIRLMFWSGAGFDEEGLTVKGGKFKDASVFYNEVSEINTADLKRWLKKSVAIQWDYKNIVKRKGRLERLK